MAPPVRSAAFLPVRHLKGLEKFPEAERSLLEQLNAIRQDLARLQALPVFTELKTGDYLAREEEYVRYAPGTGGATLMLPTPRPENKGSRVTLLLENVTLGSLTVQCVGGLVNRLTRETLGSVCRVDYVSDGLTGWVSEIALSILAGAGLSYTAGALAVNGSTSITVTSDEVRRAALTGDVTSPANSNATTIAANAVTNAKLAQMVERRVKLRADGAGTGDPTDGTGEEVGELIRFNNEIADAATTGTVTTYALTNANNVVRFLVGIGATTIRGATIPASEGQVIFWENNDGTGASVTFNHEDGSAAAAGNRFRCPGAVAFVLASGHRMITCYISTRWRIVATA